MFGVRPEAFQLLGCSCPEERRLLVRVLSCDERLLPARAHSAAGEPPCTRTCFICSGCCCSCTWQWQHPCCLLMLGLQPTGASRRSTRSVGRASRAAVQHLAVGMPAQPLVLRAACCVPSPESCAGCLMARKQLWRPAALLCAPATPHEPAGHVILALQPWQSVPKQRLLPAGNADPRTSQCCSLVSHARCKPAGGWLDKRADSALASLSSCWRSG